MSVLLFVVETEKNDVGQKKKLLQEKKKRGKGKEKKNGVYIKKKGEKEKSG